MKYKPSVLTCLVGLAGGILFMLVGVISMISLPRPLPEMRMCGVEDLPSRTGNLWQIVSSEQPAHILWQRVQETRFLDRRSSYVPNAGLAIADEQVILLYEELCGDTSELNAFSLTTGIDQWQLREAPGRIYRKDFPYRYYASVFRTLAPAETGFVLAAGDNWLFRFNDEPSLLWATNHLPSRSVNHVVVDHDYTYVTTHSTGYKLNSNDGAIIETIPIANMLAYYGDLTIIGDPAQDKLLIIEPSSQVELASIPVSDVLLENQRNSLHTRLFQRFGDVLFVYNDFLYPTRINAYRVHTGEFMYTLTVDLETFPVVTGGRLITYGSQGLDIYDLASGLHTNRIVLQFDGELHALPEIYQRVWLAAKDDMLVINFRALGDLLAIDLG